MARVPLPGSHRHAALGAEKIGPANPSDKAHVTVYIRGRDKPPPVTEPGRYITSEQYTAMYGASEEDFQAIRDFAKQYNLAPANENPATRSIELWGTVLDLSRAFGVTLDRIKIKDREYRGREGEVTIPDSLLPIVTAIVGLDNRPQAEPHVRKVCSMAAAAANETLVAQAFSPEAIGQLYDFPAGLDGTGQIIAVIELAGGFLQSDLDTYFKSGGLQTPSISAVSVGTGQNSVSAGSAITDEELEVALDIQIAGALAPGAKQLVYFSGTSDQAFLAAVNAAIVAKPQPTVISISWGKAEIFFTPQMRQQFEAALLHAAQLGIPVTVASGDNGSFDRTGSLNVDFPASATHALGCGGTNLLADGNSIGSETVWNAVVNDANGNPVREGTGGGVSQFFPKPSYQSSANVPSQPAGTGGGRGVPDVAGAGDPATGYKVCCKGSDLTVGGTSAVAPLWAALIARFGQKLGRPVGFLNPLLYQNASAFNDVIQGDNDSQGQGGLYKAGPGWDPCTGLGSPKGSALLQALLETVGEASGNGGNGTSSGSGSPATPGAP